MKKASLFLLALFFALSLNLNAQNESFKFEEAYSKTHTGLRKPMPYQHLREADVMWSKVVWRQLELREKMNHHLYFPNKPIGDRKSLIDLLLEGIHTQGLLAYGQNGMDEFGTQLTEREIHERMGSRTDTVWIDTDEGPQIPKVVERKYDSKEIKKYWVKELWFFDKQRSLLEVRIIGICPILEFYREEDQEETTPYYKQVFWIYYPEARKLLASNPSYNAKNDAQQLSFDDVFQKRFFSSFIVAESNVFNNRLVSDYTFGLESLLEAERVKENIFNFEQDLWEY